VNKMIDLTTPTLCELCLSKEEAGFWLLMVYVAGVFITRLFFNKEASE